MNPYRKPTQVDEERILMRTSDSLMNSLFVNIDGVKVMVFGVVPACSKPSVFKEAPLAFAEAEP